MSQTEDTHGTQAAENALELTSPLWDFALELYAAEGVAENLLALQNEHQCRVNQLLFAIWAATQQMHLTRPLSDELTHWQGSIGDPLRQLRFCVRQLKAQQGELAEFYKKLLAAELAAEQVELAHFYRARFVLSERGDQMSCEQLMTDNLAWAAPALCMPQAQRLVLLRTQALEFLQRGGQNTEL